MLLRLSDDNHLFTLVLIAWRSIPFLELVQDILLSPLEFRFEVALCSWMEPLQFSAKTIVLGMLMRMHSVAAMFAMQVTEAYILVG